MGGFKYVPGGCSKPFHNRFLLDLPAIYPPDYLSVLQSHSKCASELRRRGRRITTTGRKWYQRRDTTTTTAITTPQEQATTATPRDTPTTATAHGLATTAIIAAPWCTRSGHPGVMYETRINDSQLDAKAPPLPLDA
ncbi:hypothetical protein FJTKL_01698 [Diaporthe vaccinii]|uniref:Uncharacterized protein n=1 Tax=Diaporthe vaccinii TaxID=105482 RepID=A0ABR4DZM5_9PEZI